MSELLPCPFCGGEADIEEIPGSPFTNEPYTWAVGCKSCNIGWYEETQAEATSKWNRRAQPENEPLTLEELIQKCTPKAAELLKRGLFGAVKVCAVDETIQKTNADRIRSMSDEELARFLWEQNGGNRYWKSVEKYLDWLQQPVKEE
jgi:Lar family restriction alleviation protein